MINTPVKRRLDLAKAATAGALASSAKLFSGSAVAPGSPKRAGGGGARDRDLLTTRSRMKE